MAEFTENGLASDAVEAMKNGSASDLVEANVEVTLINGDGEDPADVYGLITATHINLRAETVLFQKSVKEYIQVRPGQLIPLSRSVVVVPLDSILIIEAKLMDYDSLSPDDEIANGKADFPGKSNGAFSKSITGKYGEISVKITWTPR